MLFKDCVNSILVIFFVSSFPFLTGCKKVVVPDKDNYISVCSVGGREELFWCSVGGECMQMSGGGFSNNPTINATDKIVYYSTNRDKNSEIYYQVIPPSPGEPVRLTNNSTDDSCPSISSGGDKLAYVSEAEGNRNVYLLDIGSGKSTQITNSPEDETYPSISLDGSRIVFSRTTRNGIVLVISDISDLMKIRESVIPVEPGLINRPILFDGHSKVMFMRNGKEDRGLYWAETETGSIHKIDFDDGEPFSFSYNQQQRELLVMIDKHGGGKTNIVFIVDENTMQLEKTFAFPPPRSGNPLKRIKSCNYTIWEG